RVGMDQVQPEITEEQLLAEARPLPPGLPCLLRHPARLALADLPAPSCLLPCLLFCLVRTHPHIQSTMYSPVIPAQKSAGDDTRAAVPRRPGIRRECRDHTHLD